MTLEQIKDTFDGENYFKYKGETDPMEKNWIVSNEIVLEAIENKENMHNCFKELLYTHNTTFDSFMEIFGGEEKVILAGRKGAQFRYGIDSQYGDVTFIMKKGFQTFCGKGKTFEGIEKGSRCYVTIDYVVKPGNSEMCKLDKNSEKFIKDNAKLFSFREFDKFETFSSAICMKTEYDFLPTWCNIQLHLNCNVSIDLIETIIIPGFYKNRVDKLVLSEDITKKIIYIENIAEKNYYSCKDYYQCIQDEHIPNEALTRRVSRPPDRDYKETKYPVFGNSSKISTSPQVFDEQTKIYMKKVIELCGFNPHCLEYLAKWA